MDVAFNLNRSIAGLWTGDVLRAATAVSTAGMLPGASASRVVATLSANETAVAVLAAALLGGQLLGDVAVIGTVVSWENIVSSPRYVTQSYYSFVFGGQSPPPPYIMIYPILHQWLAHRDVATLSAVGQGIRNRAFENKLRYQVRAD